MQGAPSLHTHPLTPHPWPPPAASPPHCALLSPPLPASQRNTLLLIVREEVEEAVVGPLAKRIQTCAAAAGGPSGRTHRPRSRHSLPPPCRCLIRTLPHADVAKLRRVCLAMRGQSQKVFDVPRTVQSPSAWAAACREMAQVGAVHLPSIKLDALLAATRAIYTTYKFEHGVEQSATLGADDFLPVRRPRASLRPGPDARRRGPDLHIRGRARRIGQSVAGKRHHVDALRQRLTARGGRVLPHRVRVRPPLRACAAPSLSATRSPHPAPRPHLEQLRSFCRWTQRPMSTRSRKCGPARRRVCGRPPVRSVSAPARKRALPCPRKREAGTQNRPPRPLPGVRPHKHASLEAGRGDMPTRNL